LRSTPHVSFSPVPSSSLLCLYLFLSPFWFLRGVSLSPSHFSLKIEFTLSRPSTCLTASDVCWGKAQEEAAVAALTSPPLSPPNNVIISGRLSLLYSLPLLLSLSFISPFNSSICSLTRIKRSTQNRGRKVIVHIL